MKAGPHKVNPHWKVLTVQGLKLLCKVAEYPTSILQIGKAYLVLVHKSHTRHKLAVVCVVSFREHAIEQSRPQAIHIQEELPGLVPTC
jgi:hypothetical protein